MSTSPAGAATSPSASSRSRSSGVTSPRAASGAGGGHAPHRQPGRRPGVGHIEFFKPVSYWDAFELSYQLYDPTRFTGRGYATEAVQLLVDYLFGAKKQHRIHLVIVPENAAVPTDRGEVRLPVLEGTVRGAFFNDGRSHDLLIYSLVRTDRRPWAAESHVATGT